MSNDPPATFIHSPRFAGAAQMRCANADFNASLGCSITLSIKNGDLSINAKEERDVTSIT